MMQVTTRIPMVTHLEDGSPVSLESTWAISGVAGKRSWRSRQKSEQGQKVNAFSRKLIHRFPGWDGRPQNISACGSPYMEHEAEGDSQNDVKAPWNRTPVEQWVNRSPVLNGTHLRNMRLICIKHPLTERIKKDICSQSGCKHMEPHWKAVYCGFLHPPV